MAHLRQSRPGSGLDFQVKVLKTIEVVSKLVESGFQLFACLRVAEDGAPPFLWVAATLLVLCLQFGVGGSASER